MDATIEVRPYRNADLGELLEAWNRNLYHDVMTPQRFLDRVVLDDNFDADLALVARAEEGVAGFCLGMKRSYPYLTRGLEPDRGWIVALFVDEPHRRQGLGSRLVGEVERRLAERGALEITLGAYSPGYFMPGIDISYEGALPFFATLGYDDRGEAVSMERGLFDYALPKATRERIKELRDGGVRIEPFSKKHLDATLDFLGAEFGAGWLNNVRDALRAHEAEDTTLIALTESNEVIGFCTRKIDGNEERFGPIGVRSDLRSRGLGGVLLDLQMLEMKKHGINCLYFLWTSGDAIRFYARHGFKTYRTYRMSRKSLVAADGR